MVLLIFLGWLFSSVTVIAIGFGLCYLIATWSPGQKPAKLYRQIYFPPAPPVPPAPAAKASPLYVSRWGAYHQASTRREKESWEEDFARAEALAAKPPEPPASKPPASKRPEPESRPSEEAVYATLRERLAGLQPFE
jgi:hypothetical protein